MHIPLHYRPVYRPPLHAWAAGVALWLVIAAIAYGFAVIFL